MEILETLLAISYIATALIMLFFYIVHKFDIKWAGEVNIQSNIPMWLVVILAWVFSPVTLFIMLAHMKLKKVK